jgi:hypothetical protein
LPLFVWIVYLAKAVRSNAMNTISALLILLVVHAQTDMRQASLTAERIRNAKRIVVDYASGGMGLGYHGRCFWVFEASGKCIGETSFVANWRNSNLREMKSYQKRYDLPPETFLEVQRVLLKSNFWTLKRRELSSELSEGGYSSSVTIIITCDGAEPETECPDQCEGLLQFIDKLPERGREISVTDSRQESPRR